jgi:hypothetical protein
MADDFTDVTTEGYGSRLGGSIIGVLIGIVLLPISIGLLYWNEGRAVEAQTALTQGAKELVEIVPDRLDPAAEGKLVHLSGAMTLGAGAKDPLFGATGHDLARLQRNVEMYQWKEQEQSSSHQSVGGSKTTEKTYSYQLEWSSQAINSGTFKHPEGHQNPAMPVHTETFDSDDAKLGAYKLGSAVLDKIDDFKPYTPDQALTPPDGYRREGDNFFHGTGNPAAPVLGDVKISFSAINAEPVSVVAGLSGGTLAEFHGANGYTIAMAQAGVASAAELFKVKKQEEGNLSWILRGVGWLVMFIGLMLIARPISMVLAFLPFLEGIAETGAFLIALMVSLPLTLLIIAIAWIVHRPILGVGLLVAAGALFWLLKGMRRKPAVAISR